MTTMFSRSRFAKRSRMTSPADSEKSEESKVIRFMETFKHMITWRRKPTWSAPRLIDVHDQALKQGLALTTVQPCNQVLRKYGQLITDNLTAVSTAHVNTTFRPNNNLFRNVHYTNVPGAYGGVMGNGGGQLEAGKVMADVKFEEKVFCLLKTGFILQYSDVGSTSRKPERYLKLGPDSLALANMALQGYPWLIQVYATPGEAFTAHTQRSASEDQRHGAAATTTTTTTTTTGLTTHRWRRFSIDSTYSLNKGRARGQNCLTGGESFVTYNTGTNILDYAALPLPSPSLLSSPFDSTARGSVNQMLIIVDRGDILEEWLLAITAAIQSLPLSEPTPAVSTKTKSENRRTWHSID